MKPSSIEWYVDTLYKIARINSSYLSLEEIGKLIGSGLTKSDLVNIIDHTPVLYSKYTIIEGFLAERNARSEEILHFKARSELARKYISYGRRALSFMRSGNFLLLSISGSTSYNTPSEYDDIDVFAVTRDDSVWIMIAKSLVTARLLNLLNRDSPRLCFSYIVSERFAFKKFRHTRDPLFARDALSAIVVKGNEFYVELLKVASWMSDYFPGIYSRKLGSANGRYVEQPNSLLRRIANMFLYFLVSKYIKIRAFCHNRKLSAQGRHSSIFKPKLSLDYCIFESNRYATLRSVYSASFKRQRIT